MTYPKARDRHAPRKAAEGRRVRCACGELTFTPYWWTIKGKPRPQPLCPACHEDEVRRMTRDGTNPDNRIRDEDT